MHFIKELIENIDEQDPLKKLKHIHRHFVRYSKGEFAGPALSARFSAKNITIKAGFEYEDVLLLVAGNSLNDDEFKVTGALIGARDFTDKMGEIGLDWVSKKSTGKTKNYKCVIKPADNKLVTRKTLIDLVETLSANVYILLTFKAAGNTITLTTKKNPPRPKQSGGKGVKDTAKEAAALLSFSSLKVPNTEKVKNLLLDSVFFDFKDEIPAKAKKIEVFNKYSIKELIFPSKEILKKSSTLYRVMTLRKGELIRECKIDDNEFSNDYNMTI